MDVLAAMRVYTRVVELGSLSAAARALGLGQPSVSETLARLERRLGAKLVDRTTRSLRTTDAGAVYYEYAKRTLAEAAEAEAAVASLSGGLVGRLRVSAPYGLGEILLTPVLLGLMKEHPGLTVELVLNDRFVDPTVEGVDLSIRLGPVGVGDYVARRLGSLRRLLVASPAYLAEHGQPRSPTELADRPFVRFAGLLSGDRVPLSGPGGRFEVPVRVAFLANHWRPLRQALLAGIGIGGVQYPIAAEALDSGELVPVLTDWEHDPQEVHAIYPAGRHVPEKTRMLAAVLEKSLSPLLAD